MAYLGLHKWVGVVCGLLLAFTAMGQSALPLGSWSLHAPNNRAKALAETKTSVYVATEDGFFRLIKSDNTVQTLSKIDGFSDVNLSTLAYDSASETLVVAYENTNIDLLRNGKIYNLTDLLRKPLIGAKEIYHIYTHEKKAYLSTSFGLVVLDLERREVKDTYSNIGPQGEVVQVYAATVLKDSVYIASSMGIMAANMRSANLQDFKSWRRFGQAQGLPNGNPDFPTRNIATFQEAVYTGVSDQGMFRFNGVSWETAPFNNPSSRYVSMYSNGKRLAFANAHEIVEVNAALQMVTRRVDPTLAARMVLPARDGGQWIASYSKGLVRFQGATESQAYAPAGPAYGNAFSVYAEPGKFTVVGGGFSQSYVQNESTAGYYQFQNGAWTSFDAGTGVYADSVRDIVGAVRNPVNGKFYLASYGDGLLEFEAGATKAKVYNEKNSTLRLTQPGEKPFFVRVPGVAVDQEGSVWVTNRNQVAQAAGLHQLKPDGTWEAHPFPGIQFANTAHKVLVDDLGYKWVSLSINAPGSGLVVYDHVEGRYKYLGEGSIGGLPNGQVHAMAVDLNGEVWVGTSDGVAVFTSSSSIFTSSSYSAYLPIYERRPLLQGQVIRSIAVDGGNRKWIGTDTGLWLFSETGEEMVLNFTTKNSPLPSDKIREVAIDHSTGDVMVATDGGIAIYKGASTKTEKVEENCLNVFPNPVRAGFTGTIGISGLPNNGWVKITDISGVLVYEGKSAGGTFAWNGTNYNGQPAKPGVYLVMASSADGSETCTAKIAIQR
ncbi:hypothetical protein [Rufibacter sp. LB8]|uniref:type IX secretion system anionic LPS delivery protein PorZ n=1 Tax=Rufibacter sp. LB8 TaxID=2777781 RepID=UPI00178C6FED|nr:hypothetical protein [Rufibacter sp. LB8]